MPHPLRLAFAGTPAFAATILASLLAHGPAPCAVLTQPDRRAGRGRHLQPSPVKRLALDAGLALLQPEQLRDRDAQADIAALDLDLLVVAAYGLLLPPAVLDLPRRGCLNVHASLLPRWRGASPIQAAIAAGDAVTGVSIMQMDVGLDTGPVRHSRSLTLAGHETAEDLEASLASLGAVALREVLADLDAAAYYPCAQDDALASHAPRLTKTDAALDFSRPATQLARQIRAFWPWPVAYTSVAGERLRILRAEVAEASQAPSVAPGSVVRADADGIVVACGEGLLVIKRLQRAGAKALAAADFLHARPMAAGTLLANVDGARAAPAEHSR